MNQRAGIVGTAPSWTMTPWDDPGLRITTLNDAYSMGIQRIDEQYELHPLDKMWFRPKNKRDFRPDEIPEGVKRGEMYIRPEGHLEWLKEQAKTIPVWLQAEPPSDWPVNAQRFPLEQIEAEYGSYWACGPSYMLAHLHARGFRQFEIYGIHLSTEAEYIQQRPQFENLLGRILGARVKERIADHKRYYEGEGGTVVLPVGVPILQHGWKYGYEPRPVRPDHEAAQRIKTINKQLQKLANQLMTWPRWKSKADQLKQLARLKAELADAQQQARHAVISAGRAA